MKNYIFCILFFTSAGITLVGCCKSEPEPEPKSEPIIEARTDTSGVLVTSDGSRLPYSIDGEGIPCIVAGGPSYMPIFLSEELRDYFQFIFMHTRENVSSDSLGKISGLTLEDYLLDIEELRSCLMLGEVCIFGHSISGLYALSYARQYPQFASHVIMNGTPPTMDDEFKQLRNDYWETHASEGRKAVLEDNWCCRFDTLEPYPNCSWCLNYVKNGPKYFYDSTFDASPYMLGVYSNPDVNLGSLLEQYDVDIGPELTVPVFLALGRFDFAVPYISWDNRGVLLSNLTIQLFNKSGHFAMFEEPTLYNEKLIEWINSTL